MSNRLNKNMSSMNNVNVITHEEVINNN